MPRPVHVSLAANVVLAGAVATLLWLRPPADAGSAVAPGTAPHEASRGHGPETAGPREVAAGASDTSPPTVLAQFQRLGVTRDVVVNALLGEVHRRWDERFAALEKRYAPRQVPEREYLALARQRDADQVLALKQALGEQDYLAWHKDHTLRMLNVGGVSLSAPEAEQAYRLQREFDEEYAARQMAMEDGVADAADLGRLHAQAQAALDRQLEQLLGAQRFQQMRGISSPIADVQRRYGDLNPTEAQAQAVLRAEEQYLAGEAALAARLKTSSDDTAAIAQTLEAMRAARDQELRRTFGAEAYDAVLRQQDPTYRRLTQFAAAWELQDHELTAAYETLSAFHAGAERTRAAAALREAAGHPVDWPAVRTAIEDSRQQTESSLREVLGPARADRLKQNDLLALP